MRIAVIGAGPAGIAAGHELLKQGFTDFTIFDALDAPGGTWRLHSYPGLACDVWAHSYSFSYAPNPDWSHRFSPGADGPNRSPSMFRLPFPRPRNQDVANSCARASKMVRQRFSPRKAPAASRA